jgi:hypothetical protein
MCGFTNIPCRRKTNGLNRNCPTAEVKSLSAKRYKGWNWVCV